ncbi:hypothetical protein ACH3Y9_01410 [Streptomyces sp. WSLK1-5]|uniref:hypothetical protein n=1 Tax=unclassified Streptomyces TaxID=2593676 RepID=UPI00163AD498|nr:hypothetical protein [Streptomyces sp. RP5T]
MQGTAQIPPQATESMPAPERVETRLGSLDFRPRVPTEGTANRVHDPLDHVRAVSAFLDRSWRPGEIKAVD